MPRVSFGSRASLPAFLIVFLLFIGTPVVFAARPLSGNDYDFSAGMKAQSFELLHNGSGGNDYGLGYQYSLFTRDNRAIRVGLATSMNYQRITQGQDIYNNSGTTVVSSDANRFDGTIQTSLQMAFYPMHGERLQTWVAVGPIVDFRWISIESTQSTRSTDSGTFATNRNQNTVMHYWEAGALGTVGVQWFLAPRFSLHATYGGSLQWEFYREDVDITTPDPYDLYEVYPDYDNTTEKQYVWRLATHAVSAGLTFYY